MKASVGLWLFVSDRVFILRFVCSIGFDSDWSTTIAVRRRMHRGISCATLHTHSVPVTPVTTCTKQYIHTNIMINRNSRKMIMMMKTITMIL